MRFHLSLKCLAVLFFIVMYLSVIMFSRRWVLNTEFVHSSYIRKCSILPPAKPYLGWIVFEGVCIKELHLVNECFHC